MVRQDARARVSAVLRCRLPLWLRSMDLSGGHKLGHHGARNRSSETRTFGASFTRPGEPDQIER